MEGDERVTVRLSREDVDLLLFVASREQGFDSASDVVRRVVEDYLSERFTPEERAKALEDAERRRAADPNRFTADGEDAQRILTEVISKGMDDGKEE
ncbi:hypothetical protein TALC_00045 [Thermoplasmatales archaeon BRNA1]|nr:hypothetical protein TALC_00045 [Thermoplasmatales archaeon BRNA1]